MANNETFSVGAEVEVRVFGQWRPGTVVGVGRGQGPDGEDLYTVEYRQPDGSLNSSGGKTTRLVRTRSAGAGA